MKMNFQNHGLADLHPCVTLSKVLGASAHRPECLRVCGVVRPSSCGFQGGLMIGRAQFLLPGSGCFEVCCGPG